MSTLFALKFGLFNNSNWYDTTKLKHYVIYEGIHSLPFSKDRKSAPRGGELTPKRLEKNKKGTSQNLDEKSPLVPGGFERLTLLEDFERIRKYRDFCRTYCKKY